MSAKAFWRLQIAVEQARQALQIPPPYKITAKAVAEILQLGPPELKDERAVYTFDAAVAPLYLRWDCQFSERLELAGPTWIYWRASIDDGNTISFSPQIEGDFGGGADLGRLARVLAPELWPGLPERLSVPLGFEVSDSLGREFFPLQGMLPCGGMSKPWSASQLAAQMWLTTGIYPELLPYQVHWYEWQFGDEKRRVYEQYTLDDALHRHTFFSYNTEEKEPTKMTPIGVEYLPILGIEVLIPNKKDQPMQFKVGGEVFMEGESGCGFTDGSGTLVRTIELPNQIDLLLAFQRQFYLVPR